MTKPTPIAALLIAAFLSGTVFCAELDRATAGQVAATASLGPSVTAPPGPRGRAYLFRGFAGMVFSRGTDKLDDRIKQAGFMATVNEAMMCPKIAKEAIDDYRRDPALIILIGHSVGGACVLSFAEMLQDERIPVSLLVTTEPARISHDVPLNVERYINIYQSDSVLGGVDVAPAQGFQGHYATFDIVEHKEISHVNMEKADFLHDQVLGKILQLAATPAKAISDGVPIHYMVPADAAIELWDSGMPVYTRPGDTLQTLATFYRLPLWSLSQVNQVPDDAQLMPGQRVIIPRNLVPPPLPSNPAPSRQARWKH
ncbi:MAG: LysM peptidoglycan-binding domain-containing protein [Xanthobacteraceae bacterium]